jgi:hypothetical protein
VIRDPETGHVWGTKAEIAIELGLHPDTGPELVRSWGRRGRVSHRHVPGVGRGTVLYRYDEAVEEERRSRRAGKGRPRA